MVLDGHYVWAVEICACNTVHLDRGVQTPEFCALRIMTAAHRYAMHDIAATHG